MCKRSSNVYSAHRETRDGRVKRRRRKQLQHQRHAVSRQKKQLRRQRRRRWQRHYRKVLPRFVRQSGDVIYLDMPEELSLRNPRLHTSLCELLAELRDAFRRKPARVHINFSQVRLLLPEGTLLFYAELHRLVSNFEHQSVGCRPAEDETVDGVLQQVGIYEMLGYHSERLPHGDNVVQWSALHGEVVDSAVFGPKIESLNLESDEARDLFKAVSEAVSNVLGHAYLDVRYDGLPLDKPNGWWMFCRESKDALYVAVCDLGIGIPRSLPLRHGREKVVAALNRFFGRRHHTDGHSIYAALRIGRSRTDQSHRGKGFNDMMRAIDAQPGSWMNVFSNHGFLSYREGSERPGIKNFAFKRSILGTIVCWRFPFKGSTHV